MDGTGRVKIILFYSPTFWFRTFQKILDQAPEQNMEAECREAVVVFYQVEEGDLDLSLIHI